MKSKGQNTGFFSNKTLNLQGQLLSLEKPLVMGVLNVTPDSFFDGGKYLEEKQLLERAEKMIMEGADIIDVGGLSSRPVNATMADLKEETQRITRAISLLRKTFAQIPLSIDTFRCPVAQAALEEGVNIINDISAGSFDPDLPVFLAGKQVPYIIMHLQGTFESMHATYTYKHIGLEVSQFFSERIKKFHAEGIADIIIDPGFGFSKNKDQNFELLNHLDHFCELDKPVLVGISRKSMIWKTLQSSPEDALNGTTALHSIALLKGANILRVHDVKEALEVITLMKELTKSQ